MAKKDEYLQLLDLLYQVAQSLEGKSYPDKRLHDCNRLALKIFSHAATVYWLKQGTKAPIPEPDGADFFDMASVAVITRSALDTYLTMYELFFEHITDDEKEFRYALWILSGFVIRDDIVPSDPTLIVMRERIKNTATYASITKKQQRQVLEKGKRVVRDIRERAKVAGFGPKTIQQLNQYLSSYVHSDGLSAVQIMEADTSEKQKGYIENCMNIIKMIMSKMILEYKNLFPSAEAWCLAKPKALLLAEKWSEIAQRLR